MTQFVKPLAGIRDKSTTGVVLKLAVVPKAVTQAFQAIEGIGRKEMSRRLGQLIPQKGTEPLLTALKIIETPLCLQTEGLLQRPEPLQQLLQLPLGQPAGVVLLGSGGVCQGLRASRSRQRRSQWRCCRTIVSSSRCCSRRR